MKAYRHLVKHALAAGNAVSVFDGEEWSCKRSTSFKQIIDDIESVEQAQLIIRNGDGDKLGWALIILDVNDDETVADYSDNDYFEAWYSIYNR